MQPFLQGDQKYVTDMNSSIPLFFPGLFLEVLMRAECCAVESDAQSPGDADWTARPVSSGCKHSISAATLTMALLDVKSLPNRKPSNFYLFPLRRPSAPKVYENRGVPGFRLRGPALKSVFRKM